MTQPSSAATTRMPTLREIMRVDLPVVEICDVGAMLEGADRFASLVEQGLANVSGFEPNPKELARLRASPAPRRRYFPNFLGRGDNRRFHVTRYPGCSSLYDPDPRVIDLFTSIGATLPDGNFAVVSSEQVNTSRLDEVDGMPRPIDYLKVDVQGAELDVLAGATQILTDVLVIEAEVEFVPLYKDQPLFGDVQSFLRERGFVLHKFLDLGGRCFRPIQAGPNPFVPMSQLLWADAIFVRDFARLEALQHQQLLKSALILYETYRSHDLVHLHLAEHDRRHGGALAEQFWRIISQLPKLPAMYMNHKVHI